MRLLLITAALTFPLCWALMFLPRPGVGRWVPRSRATFWAAAVVFPLLATGLFWVVATAS